MFMNSLIISMIISISSSNWMGMWMGMEINLLSIIPLMNSSKNSMPSESSLKYFITQAIASTMILFSIMFSLKFAIEKTSLLFILLNSSLLIKMGAAPFHFWFPEVLEGLSWNNCMLMLTSQKITPMVLLMYNINFPKFISLIIIISSVVSTFMSFNQISLRKMMAYSSINHIAWMLSTMLFTKSMWINYFIIYSVISINIIIMFKLFNVFFISQFISKMNDSPINKIFFSMNFMSLGGIPPFLGFMPKWMAIQTLILNKFYMITLILMISSLIMLFVYMRISFTSLILNFSEILIKSYKSKKMNIIMFMNFTSMNTLILVSLNFNLT
uniref:NADH-ubiquinone oxidoreductase chain 2 n=1 Tax=Sepedophilus bipunctatus TaxID=1143114 RepID=A0A0S2M8D0_9COLE|nr:NADH dehydrogenase subunit 2 [Sepedophilus bipunctatus]ALO70923.1 NADH deshydrogenase subunit 2 [Sepedophilus bipunctatus]